MWIEIFEFNTPFFNLTKIILLSDSASFQTLILFLSHTVFWTDLKYRGICKVAKKPNSVSNFMKSLLGEGHLA